MADIAETLLSFDDTHLANQLFGSQNANLSALAEHAGVQIASRGNTVTIKGDPEAISCMANTLTQLYGLLKSNTVLAPNDFVQAYTMIEQEPKVDLKKIFKDNIFVASPRKTITPKTLSQRGYLQALRDSDMIFAVGPAGTGKTYLAVAMALSLLTSKKVKRLILTRPAVEAGEKLGFLPGDMAQKVNPYLRPLYDALHDMLDFDKVAEMLENGSIEIAPLAFMRGRTLNDAFIILDEAQNTTVEQMKMFVTRLGFGSRAVITGDITQIDLPPQNGKINSGLVHALKVLNKVEGVAITHFRKEDVVRHALVGRIVDAYEQHNENT